MNRKLHESTNLIKKCLDLKRKQFFRLYFVDDSSLLSVLSQSKDYKLAFTKLRLVV